MHRNVPAQKASTSPLTVLMALANALCLFLFRVNSAWAGPGRSNCWARDSNDQALGTGIGEGIVRAAIQGDARGSAVT